MEALDKSLPVPAVNLEAELSVATLQSIQEQLDHAQQAMREIAESFPENDNLKSIPGLRTVCFRGGISGDRQPPSL